MKYTYEQRQNVNLGIAREFKRDNEKKYIPKKITNEVLYIIKQTETFYIFESKLNNNDFI